jgi:PTH1 family peptidyl-tRNA hydrolase
VPGVGLIVGLGNPGLRYQDTRHNAGFWFLAAIAHETPGVAWKTEPRFHGQLAKVVIAGRAVRLFQPHTYMNRSGLGVGEVSRYFQIEPEEILIAHDDLDLPPGTVRLKRGGGDGGHNGLRDLIAHLDSREFVRLRIGIGHPGSRAGVVDYVLSVPPEEQRQLALAAIGEALGVLPSILEGNLDEAMNRLHSRNSGAPAPGACPGRDPS